jgi:hypothetical protein
MTVKVIFPRKNSIEDLLFWVVGHFVSLILVIGVKPKLKPLA